MRTHAAQPGQIPPIGLQGGDRGVKAVQGLVRDGHDLRVGEGGGTLELHQHAHGLAPQILSPGIAGVLIGPAGGVAVKRLRAQGEGVRQPQPGEQLLSAFA